MPKRFFTQLQSYSFNKRLSLSEVQQELSEYDVDLEITYKKIKNINFRLKSNKLYVSAPIYVTEAELSRAIASKISWILKKIQQSKQRSVLFLPEKQLKGVTDESIKLWGKNYNLRYTSDAQKNSKKSSFIIEHEHQTIYINISNTHPATDEKPEIRQFNKTIQVSHTQEVIESLLIELFRQELNHKMSSLFCKWQPIVGKSAKEMRIKKMTTRWGTCNIHKKRVWLSLYLAQFPIKCTEYVIVHELCHLYEANHSPKFWKLVEQHMPDYKIWHDMLKSKDF